MLKSQEEELSNLLIEYSAGNYSAKGKLSDKNDEVDMIISGINMLGEELRETNVDKDYFLGIYNAVTDLVIITNTEGIIDEVNNSVLETFRIQKKKLINSDIHDLIGKKRSFFDNIKTQLNGTNGSFVFENVIHFNEIEIIGLVTYSKIIDRFGLQKGYLISIKDITESKKMEQLIMRAIISTEQKEQSRMADDLHDSLGQELSMTKLMLTNLEKYNKGDKNYSSLIETTKNILDEAITHLKEICFNLMPSVLIKGDIYLAIRELTLKLNSQNLIKFDYKHSGLKKEIDSEIEIMIFRIIQEFVNNSIKHSEASNVLINTIICPKDGFKIKLSDNGKGFNMEILKPYTDSRGINNLESKIKAFNGTYSLESKEGIGTKLTIHFPKI